MFTAAIHGFVLAFPLIIPLGVQNVFIFNQGLVQPRYSRVLPVVLTAAICDTILIALAVTGVSAMVLASPVIKNALIVVGAVFLAFMGWSTWKTKSEVYESSYLPTSLPKQVLFAASVSLFNPHAIMDTVGVIGTSSLAYQGLEKMAFASSTILVSWIWFFSLSIAGRMIGTLDNSGGFINVINKVSALIMWAAAIYLLTSL